MTDSAPAENKFPYPWRLLFLLCILALLGSLAVVPYSITLSGNFINGTQGLPSWTLQLLVYLVTIGQAVVLYWPMIGAGLLTAPRVGLESPFLTGLLYGRPAGKRLRSMFLISFLGGVLGALVLLLISTAIFDPLMNADPALAAINAPMPTWPAWQGILASVGAGITEELILRMFLLSGIAWLGSRLLRTPPGALRSAVFWAANILSTLVFGALHISNLALINVPPTPLVIVYILVLNGMIGLLYGWLYRRFGLESAMLGHFWTDIVLKVILPAFLPG